MQSQTVDLHIAIECEEDDGVAALAVPARATRLGMDITDRQRFLGHESIATTRRYAETTAAPPQRRFDQLTDPTAHALISGIRQRQGDEAALLAADLLASGGRGASPLLVHEVVVLARRSSVARAASRIDACSVAMRAP
jgi:integrase/recombinase XerD